MGNKIKEHQKDFDPENPRDYLDFLLIEEKTNENIGWHSMIFTMFSLYLGGSDTIATTMRWILVSLSLDKKVQSKCRSELLKCLEENKHLTAEAVPYFCATLLECQRIYPAGETI